MSREIKFRAWDTVSNYMVDSTAGYFVEFDGDLWFNLGAVDNKDLLLNQSEKLILMQFTGLKDKHGTEIYEGDIVRILYTDWPSQRPETNGRYAMTLDEYKDSISNIGKVIYENVQFCIQFNEQGYLSSLEPGPHGQITVIGNVYEHPELLESDHE